MVMVRCLSGVRPWTLQLFTPIPRLLDRFTSTSFQLDRAVKIHTTLRGTNSSMFRKNNKSSKKPSGIHLLQIILVLFLASKRNVLLVWECTYLQQLPVDQLTIVRPKCLGISVVNIIILHTLFANSMIR